MSEMTVLWVVAGFLGASIGSFLTLVTYRLPREETIGLSRSRCPSCLKELRVVDLIPILSWVTSRGKCRQCKAKVSIRYPLTELATMLGTLGAVYLFGFTLAGFAVAGLWWCIVAIIVTDLEHYIILDEVQIAIIVFGALFHFALGTEVMRVIESAIIGLLIGLVLKYGFLYLRNKDGLGMGDVKLLFGVGVWLASPVAFVPFLFLAGVLGVVFGMLWRVMGRGQQFPFGPALAAALLTGVVAPQVFDAYWKLFAR
jgi:leader peptidase (prepilin peptidase)/N-methyltransferase